MDNDPFLDHYLEQDQIRTKWSISIHQMHESPREVLADIVPVLTVLMARGVGWDGENRHGRRRWGPTDSGSGHSSSLTSRPSALTHNSPAVFNSFNSPNAFPPQDLFIYWGPCSGHSSCLHLGNSYTVLKSYLRAIIAVSQSLALSPL